MSDKRCETCKWWDDLGVNVAVMCGYCRHVAAVESVYSSCFATNKNFGCIHHEVKGQDR